jgi:hypothetical protein
LIYTIPSTVIFLQVSSIPILAYMTEIGIKQWRRVCQSLDERG